MNENEQHIHKFMLYIEKRKVKSTKCLNKKRERSHISNLTTIPESSRTKKANTPEKE